MAGEYCIVCWLGKHRHSNLEGQIFSNIWAQWWHFMQYMITVNTLTYMQMFMNLEGVNSRYTSGEFHNSTELLIHYVYIMATNTANKDG